MAFAAAVRDDRSPASFASRLRVTVDAPGAGADLPPIHGRYERLADDIRFTPMFPFEPGVAYRATLADASGRGPVATRSLSFTLPEPVPGVATEVTDVHPSSPVLPENVLRFTVRFSQPMRRGQAAERILLVDAEGRPVPDALYRPPCELWDPTLRHLTVLLDPGRLKRMVGPNRALGPPLSDGDRYTLRIDAGMIDAAGRPLARTRLVHFRVGPAIREPLAFERWALRRPASGTRAGLTIEFPHPLDRTSLARALTVVRRDGRTVDGHVAIDAHGTRWTFTPQADWNAESHRIDIAPDLEDVCGNGPASAFERPIDVDGSTIGVPVHRSLRFRID